MSERPPHILTMPLRPGDRRASVADLCNEVESLRAIHYTDLALALSGGPEQARRAALSGNDLDVAVVNLLKRLRADGLA